MPSKTATKRISKTAKKPVRKTAAKSSASEGPRLRKLPRKQNKKKESLELKARQKQKSLPPAWVLMRQSLRHLYRYKKTFLGILLIYAVFYILFIKGISANFQLGSLRDNIASTFNGNLKNLNAGIALFGLLLGTAGTSSSESAGVYQSVLIVLTSLALIRALRISYSGNAKVKVKDSFYQSTASLIPFLAICFMLVLQCLPALIVGSLYSTVQTTGLLVGPLEQALGALILGAAVLWTFYMLSSTLFALYIVTLPDAKPWATLKAAKKLVKFRRVILVRKILFLPAILLLSSALVLIPLIIFMPKAAEILFLIFTILVLGVVHSYLYTLYRNLIND